MARTPNPLVKKRTRHATRPKTYDPSMLPAIENLATEGYTDAEIGMILGFAKHEKDNTWLDALKTKNEIVKEVWQRGQRKANAKLVEAAMQQALPYDYEEVDQTWKVVEDPETGESVKVLTEEKVKKKHKCGDTAMLKYLLASRMPEDFSINKTVNINHRTMTGTYKEEISSQEIRQFAGKLLDFAETEAEFGENGDEIDEFFGDEEMSDDE